LAFHGHPRNTGDLDLCVNPTEENASRLVSVLDDFGFANPGLGHSDFVEGDQIVQLDRSPNRIDLLTASPESTLKKRGRQNFPRRSMASPFL
jgi:hypothetical protein